MKPRLFHLFVECIPYNPPDMAGNGDLAGGSPADGEAGGGGSDGNQAGSSR